MMINILVNHLSKEEDQIIKNPNLKIRISRITENHHWDRKLRLVRVPLISLSSSLIKNLPSRRKIKRTNISFSKKKSNISNKKMAITQTNIRVQIIWKILFCKLLMKISDKNQGLQEELLLSQNEQFSTP